MSFIYSYKKEKKYITLKEASALSGYSSDYIGQLIRNGKISGKRVYANPVWMTTKDDLFEYLNLNRSSDNSNQKNFTKTSTKLKTLKTKIRSELELVKLYKGILYFTITVSVIFSLFVFYIFSVNFEARINQDLVQESTTTATEIPLVKETVVTF
jgi:hypothetical protein